MSTRDLKKRFPRQEQPATPFFVSVAGNIGVGKSMITTMIGEVFGWKMFFEPVITNPYLDDYYKDMNQFFVRDMFLQPALVEFDYWVRIDADTFFPAIQCVNPMLRMQEEGHSFMHVG